MCGMCGVYTYASGQPVNPRIIDAMQRIIAHRGPDDTGVHLDGNLGLGFRRLSIIDLPGGHQPMTNEDGSVVLVFNGEIYNFKALRSWLIERGHVFASSSDSEVIIHLYEELGDDCVQELRGMFGFAIWDARRRRLLLARDRLGIKPLYYARHDERLVFGSEIKALLMHPDVPAELNQRALSNFLSLKYVPAPQTMFMGIAALPPAHYLTCDADGIQVRPYWRLSFAAGNEADPIVNEEPYVERLEALLHEIIDMHLVSDVPFGAFLSGGIDSSTIVALMTHFLNEPVKTFSVGFEGASAALSELPYAHMVARQYGTDHHDILVGPDDIPTLAQRVVWHQDQPIADPASIANYMVSSLAASHVKMVLTGEGGDELFAGYARYEGEQWSPWARRMPLGMRNAALATSRWLPGLRRTKLALYALAHTDEVTRLINWFCLFNDDHKAALLNGMAGASEGWTAREAFDTHLRATNATIPLNRMLYVDTKLWLPDDLLARGDKTSMAHSLEARVPFLDHKLVEFAAELPAQLKLNRLGRKYLLKRVSSRLLPPEIITRKKQGFPIPLAQWFRHELRDYVRDTLAPQTIRRRGLFNEAAVTQLLDEHESGFADHNNLIWGLINVELWQQNFLDQSAAQSAPVSPLTVSLP